MRFALLALVVVGCGARTEPIVPLVVVEPPPPPPPPPPPDPEIAPAVSVAAGLFHSCAATRSGQVHCWGFNNQGQLGDGRRETRPTPRPIDGIDDAVAVTAGRYHSCALRAGGRVSCWGSNLRGELGDGSLEIAQLRPVEVVDLPPVAQVSAGADHTCAVTDAGVLFCWGANGGGQVGPDMRGSYRRPVEVPLPGATVSVAAGLSHTCALTTDGVWCWGSDIVAEDEFAPPFLPRRVELPPVVQVDSADFRSCAVSEAGEVWCWPFRGPDTSIVAAPTERLDRVAQIGAGHEFLCALVGDGGLRCWGNNERGQLGDGGAETSRTALVTPVDLPPSISVITGWRHACALDETGVIRCWGRNQEGQLGIGRSAELLPPVIAGVLRDALP